MCFNVVVAFDQIVKMNKPTEKQKKNNRDQAVDQGYQGKLSSNTRNILHFCSLSLTPPPPKKKSLKILEKHEEQET